VANFVGETNFLSGSVSTEDGRRIFDLAGGGRVAAPTGTAEGPATLMVRPESLTLTSFVSSAIGTDAAIARER
jgi:ABC-type Fe3+/spermidine/putrescine transport system ATPase subunit